MAPNSKSSRPGRQPIELPFDDGEVAPLQADDPRPQRVTQYPSNPNVRKPVRKAEEVIPTSVYDIKPKQDEEFAPSYQADESGFKPAFIYVERGPGAGQLVPVRQGTTVIGRASVAELRLQHPSISRRHAQIVRKGEFFYVKDLGSQNGTLVNNEKLSTEVEVHPGDEIVVGAALLKLRGPIQAADSAMIPSVKIKVPKKASGAVKVALFAGAVGFGLAAVMMLALLKNQKDLPSFKTPTKKASSVVLSPPVVDKKEDSAADNIVVEADPVAVKIQQAMAKEEAKAKDEPAATAELTPPVKEKELPKKEEKTPPSSAVAAAKGELKKANIKLASASSGKKTAADDAFNDEEDEAPAKKAAPASGANGAQILARYEAGNVGAAIDLAEKAGNKELLGKLETFQTSYDAAKKAFASNNAAGAIKNYEKALKMDEQLSSGWGTYGVEIRKQLSTIYTLVGQHYASQDDNDEAKKAFTVALKHDPQNAKAKSGLAALGGSEKPARSKIADAFEDEAPAKKAPAKKEKAPARAAIDDAFGD